MVFYLVGVIVGHTISVGLEPAGSAVVIAGFKRHWRVPYRGPEHPEKAPKNLSIGDLKLNRIRHLPTVFTDLDSIAESRIHFTAIP
jgi:hypothetical protein